MILGDNHLETVGQHGALDHLLERAALREERGRRQQERGGKRDVATCAAARF
jgi:hypothetical protein